MDENKPVTGYSDEEIKMLKSIQSECAKQFKRAVHWYDEYAEKKPSRPYDEIAAQQAAIGTTAQAWMEATDRLREVTPSP